ncbi:MAG: gliding motility-associated C-terminal domain-containing protein [Bacteroidales bacterium]|nr:gliding motility-associated C-terminal domain-containing protein [Bacteroidales bacterium]
MKSLLSSIIISLSILSFSQNANLLNEPKRSLSFIENQGQFDGRNWQSNNPILYAIDLDDANLFLERQGLTYRFEKIIRNPLHTDENLKKDSTISKRILSSELVHVKWLNANPNVKVYAEYIDNSYYSYAYKVTNDVVNKNHIKGFKKIIYKNIYNKIDLVYEIKDYNKLKYSFILHPGANAEDIKLKYSYEHSNINNESIEILKNEGGQIQINTSYSSVIEEAPITYYSEQKNNIIDSKYVFSNNILEFKLSDYDHSKTVEIDPWLVVAAFNTSNAVWEVEADGVGNAYVIGGETNMTLKKYNNSGGLVWTYVTPWDTSSVWIGTLATDFSGNSYVTSGTSPAMEKIDNGGSMNWHMNGGGFLASSNEFWTITFNCDKTKLIVGGTYVASMFSFDYYAAIFDIDVNSGNINDYITLDVTNIGGIGTMPVEVRSISSSKDAKYIFLTHHDVGAINQNIGNCPNEEPTFQVDNTHHLAYKCEDYLPETQNGGGLKALVSNDNYFYTHAGDVIHQWDITTGTHINSASIPNGASSTVAFTGGIVVENSGLAVDDAGNVYAGSKNKVIKYDENLNILQQVTVNFTVYDVAVSNNGEVFAVGAVQDNSYNGDRQGKIEAINMSASGQFQLICCDVNICPVDPVCSTDAPFNIDVSVSGGTFSGPGIVDVINGTFDPSVVGVGTYTITYSKPCGSETVDIEVLDCSPMNVCYDGTNITLTTGGVGTIIWEDWENFNSTISNEQECIDCPTATPNYVFGFYTGCSSSTCTGTDWVQFGTGTSVTPPSNWPMQISDDNGVQLSYTDLSSIPPCSACTPPTVTGAIMHVDCSGNNTGAINLTITGSSTYSISWSGPSFSSSNEDINNLYAGTYTVTVTDNLDASCIVTQSFIVNPGATGPTASLSGGGDICQGETANISVALTGTANWTINYTLDGIAQSSINNIGSSPYTFTGSDGSYIITSVSDASGCDGTVSGSATITEHEAVTVNNILAICNASQSDYYVTFDISNGDNTSYIVTPAGSGTLSGNTFTSNNITSGSNYSFTVTDQYGCSPVTVSGTQDCNCPVIGNLSGDNTICNSDCTDLTFTFSGGTFPYNFTYSDGTNSYNGSANTSPYTISVCPTSTTTYSLTSTSDGNCTGTSGGTALITVRDLPTGDVNFTDEICSGGSSNIIINLSGTPNWNIEYTANGGSTQTINNISSSPYSLTVSPTTNTTYTFTIVSDQYCDGTFINGTAQVNIYPTPTVVISGNEDICSGESSDISFTFTGDSPFSFDYFDGTNTTSITTNNNPHTISVNPTNSTVYTVTNFSDNNCSGTFSGSASVNVHNPINVSNITTACNASQSDYIVTFDINNGDFTSYQVTPAGSGTISGNSFTSNNIVSGTNYSFTVTDQYGCSPVAVSGSQDCNCPVIGNLTGNTNICNGDCADLTFTFSGGTFPYNFTYSDGTNTYNGTANTSPYTINVCPTNTTTYTINSCNDINCTGSSSGSATITVLALPNILLSGLSDICNGDAFDIELTFTGSAPYSISYNDGTNTFSQTGINSNPYTFSLNPTINTTYTFTSVSDNNCSQNINETIAVNVHEGVSVSNITDNCLAGDTEYEVNFDIIGGDISSYIVTPNNGSLSGSSFTSDPIPSASNYSFVVDDAWGCDPQTISGFVDCSCPIVGSLSGTQTICMGETATLTINVSGGTFPYNAEYSYGGNTYTLNNITSSPFSFDITPNANTSVTLNMISDGTCQGSVSGSANITVRNLPTATISGNTSICSGENTELQIQLTGNAPYDIIYTDGSTQTTINAINSSPFNITVNPTFSTQYSLIQVSDSYCTGTVSGISTITVNPLPNVYAGNDTSVCDGQIAILVASGAVSYVWNNNVVNQQSFIPISTQTYSVTGTDANGCENTDQVIVTVVPTPTAFAGNDQEICQGQYATLTASGGATYMWSTTQSTASIVVQPDQTTSYTVTVYNQGCEASDEVSVLVRESPIVNAGQDVDICEGEQTTLVANGSGNFEWSHGLGNTFQVNVSPTQTTTYTVTLTDNIGCSSSDDVTVTVFAPSTVTITPDQALICYGQSVTLTAIGADNYEWFPTYNISSVYGSTVTVNPTTNTTYYAHGTYGPGCESVATIDIEVDKVIVDIPMMDALCNGENVDINAIVSEGQAPYMYLWNNGKFTSSINETLHLSTSYSVTVFDAYGCSNSDMVNIYVFDSLKVDVYNNFDTLCPGDTILANASIYGGTGAPYLLSIDGEFSQNIVKLPVMENHDYIFIAEDGCMQVTDTLKVRTYPLPYVNFTSDKIAICEDESIKFYAQILPDELAESYLWNFGDQDDNNLSLSENPSHTYSNQGLYDVSLQIRTINGCATQYIHEELIRVEPKPKAEFKPSPLVTSILKPEILFTNQSLGADVYFWDFGTGDQSNLSDPLYLFKAIGNYEVLLVASTEFGCKDSTYKFIQVEPVVELWFPDAFTPDNDNHNDIFIPKGVNILSEGYELKVFDRWGEPVFVSDDLQVGWDGTIKDNKIGKTGVYSYVAKYKDIYEIEHEVSGIIHLIR